MLSAPHPRPADTCRRVPAATSFRYQQESLWLRRGVLRPFREEDSTTVRDSRRRQLRPEPGRKRLAHLLGRPVRKPKFFRLQVFPPSASACGLGAEVGLAEEAGKIEDIPRSNKLSRRDRKTSANSRRIRARQTDTDTPRAFPRRPAVTFDAPHQTGRTQGKCLTPCLELDKEKPVLQGHSHTKTLLELVQMLDMPIIRCISID